jgi:caa(3)-type oxidase subunit IV
MNRRHKHNLLVLLALFVLAAIEFGCGFIRFGQALRPLLLLPAIVMVGLVALVFMRVTTGPALVRIFAIASLFWLTILLGLGTMDPMTRAIYPVQGTELR